MLCAVTCPHPWHGIGAPKRSPATPVTTCPSSVPHEHARLPRRAGRPVRPRPRRRGREHHRPGPGPGLPADRRAGPGAAPGTGQRLRHCPRRAARQAAQRSLTLSVAVADIRALPFEDASFDAVVCADNALRTR
ncbi:class I SAM-dependent methyltransferase [Streptomyces sp. NBC_00160]|uniref:class I SAM-dependent methyltransferase n=1 Tax=Streptomyces sp. NBC_00160 TaxID=2903628 RepID=UPI002259F3CB|nr:class I SAM-dependent methyltransferase [Streptomyces sp. NBC_00160]MCX5306676.1 class I SAM-dependent methyltransferase [Streptomyces sp. NBC_00160]